MALQISLRLQHFLTSPKEGCTSGFAPAFAGPVPFPKPTQMCCSTGSSSSFNHFAISSLKFTNFPLVEGNFRGSRWRASKVEVEVDSDGGKKGKEDKFSDQDEEDEPMLMDEEERREWRKKIREVIDKNPDVEEEEDPEQRRKKMEKLLAEYPLVVDEEDPNWPDDADGRGFNLDQFFDKITIQNVRKDDDENYDSDKELVWQDDNYIRPIKDITTKEWEETVFKDISPLIVLVHNRYKRVRLYAFDLPDLAKHRNLLHRCVAVDAVVELDLVSALKVSNFPEIIFTKAGKILYREKAIRTADDLSRIMAFFYYGAAKPACLSNFEAGQEVIPSVPSN